MRSSVPEWSIAELLGDACDTARAGFRNAICIMPRSIEPGLPHWVGGRDRASTIRNRSYWYSSVANGTLSRTADGRRGSQATPRFMLIQPARSRRGTGDHVAIDAPSRRSQEHRVWSYDGALRDVLSNASADIAWARSAAGRWIAGSASEADNLRSAYEAAAAPHVYALERRDRECSVREHLRQCLEVTRAPAEDAVSPGRRRPPVGFGLRRLHRSSCANRLSVPGQIRRWSWRSATGIDTDRRHWPDRSARVEDRGWRRDFTCGRDPDDCGAAPTSDRSSSASLWDLRDV